MSMRHLRKLYGDNSLPPPDPGSDEEYEPLYAKVSPSKFNYHGLALSSHSESEHDSASAVASDDATPDLDTKKKKKKKKKLRKSKQMHKAVSKSNLEDLDEIDKSVLEVNAILGEPPKAPPTIPEQPRSDPRLELMAIQSKHLNAANELEKLFGPEEPEARRRGRQSNVTKIHRRAVIIPVTDAHNFHTWGLSMSVQRRENGCTYFVFDHSRAYQRNHRAFLQGDFRNTNLVLEDAESKLHVEGMLEGFDGMMRFEAYSDCNSLIEETIAYMQYVAHHSFILTNPKVRLEYRISENRPFHVAVMKYLYLLTNRACHRTALELAKLLLNLDPSDPLAILFVIDTLALRAREHQWLIKAVDFWSVERDAGFLFNMQYSYAMAHFHVATKSKSDTSKASELLCEAMLRFPAVLLRLLQCASVTPSAKVQACPLFNKADETNGDHLGPLMALYGKLVWSKWREPAVFAWLIKTADQLAEQYITDTDMQERAKVLENERKNLFRGWPPEMVRHLCVIKPMSNFLVDGAVPNVTIGRSADPHPPHDGVDRYFYKRPPPAPRAASIATGRSPLFELFSSVLPHYTVPLPAEYYRHIIEAMGAEDDEEEAVEEPARAPNQIAAEHAVAEIVELANMDVADVADEIAAELQNGNGDDDEDDDDDFADEVAAALRAIPEEDANAVRHLIDAVRSRRRPLNDDNEGGDDAGRNDADRHDADEPGPAGPQNNH